MARQDGQFIAVDFFENTGGLETSNSPFLAHPECASGGFNFDYVQKGALRKRKGPLLLSAADGSATLGLGFYNDQNSIRDIIRYTAGGITVFNQSDWSSTPISHETPSTALTLPNRVVSTMFTSPTTNVLWCPNLTQGLLGIYKTQTGYKLTKNGAADVSDGKLIASLSTGSGVFLATGTYRYTVTATKKSGAEGNAALEATIDVTDTSRIVLVTLTNTLDPNIYSKVSIYRSFVNGSALFTVGSLIAEITTISPTITFNDTGASIVDNQLIPRVNSTIRDYSELPTGNVKAVTTFKGRLVTAIGSTLYLSEESNPEAWPTANRLPLQTGGDITALASVSFTTQFSSTTDEYLCIFKQNECWVLSGNSLDDWVLKKIDDSGVSHQALVTQANGFLTWLNYRGLFLWNGSDKPAYISQNFEDLFQKRGIIKKDAFSESFVLYCPTRNEVQWYLQDATQTDEHTFTLKLDLRLTQLGQEQTLVERKMQGVVTPDRYPIQLSAGVCFIPDPNAPDEQVLVSDIHGAIYLAYGATSDNTDTITFNYLTQNLDMGSRGHAKRYHKVVAWVKKTTALTLGLKWWVGYVPQSSAYGSRSESVTGTTNSLVWDSGDWDEKNWANSDTEIVPITFNLSSSGTNSEGDCIQLQFEESSKNEFILYGFTVYYTDMSLRK